jgi:hypothetical protein
LIIYLVEVFRRHVELARQVYPDLVKFVWFSTVRQVVLFDPFQNIFLHVCHFHVQRSRSPIYKYIEKWHTTFKENREEIKNSERKRERVREKVHESNTPCFCLVRHVLIIKENEKERKAQSKHMVVSK